MVGEILEVVGELLVVAVQAGGKAALWMLGIAAAMVLVFVIIAYSENSNCKEKGGTMMEINGSSMCVAKDSIKKL